MVNLELGKWVKGGEIVTILILRSTIHRRGSYI